MFLEALSPRQWWKQKAADIWSVAPVWVNTSLHPLLHLDNGYQLLICSEAVWSPVSQIRHALNQKLLDIFKNWMTRVTVEISQVQSNTGETTVWCLNSDRKYIVCVVHSSVRSSYPQEHLKAAFLKCSLLPEMFFWEEESLCQHLQSQQCSLSDACISETIIKAVSLNRNRSQGQKNLIFRWKTNWLCWQAT